MAKAKNMGEQLYNLLPQIYRVEDAQVKPEPYPLKRFFQIASVGMDYLKAKIDGHADMFDLDRTPPELLPHIAKMMGFDFPYELTVQEQRSLLKILPTLYKMKGTPSVFNYLARQIYGSDAKAYSDWVSRGGANGENLIRINLEVNGEVAGLQTRIDRYYKYSEAFRPVNHKLFWSIVLYYNDVYVMRDRSVDPFTDKVSTLDLDPYNLSKRKIVYNPDILTMRDTDIFTFANKADVFTDLIRTAVENDMYNENKIISENFREVITLSDGMDTYNSAKITEEFKKESLLETSYEVYNKGRLDDRDDKTTFKVTDADNYTKQKLDSHSDVTYDFSNALNFGRLNDNLILNQEAIVTTY